MWLRLPQGSTMWWLDAWGAQWCAGEQILSDRCLECLRDFPALCRFLPRRITVPFYGRTERLFAGETTQMDSATFLLAYLAWFRFMRETHSPLLSCQTAGEGHGAPMSMEK